MAGPTVLALSLRIIHLLNPLKPNVRKFCYCLVTQVLSTSYIFNLPSCFSLFFSRNPNNSTTNTLMDCPPCVTHMLWEPLSQPVLPITGGSSWSPALLPDHGPCSPAQPLLYSSGQVEMFCHFVLVFAKKPPTNGGLTIGVYRCSQCSSPLTADCASQLSEKWERWEAPGTVTHESNGNENYFVKNSSCVWLHLDTWLKLSGSYWWSL